MDDFSFVQEYWSLEDEELNNCFQVITFSLWDHWLSNEEFEKFFPDESSKNNEIESARFIDASKEILEKEEFYIVDDSGDQFVIKKSKIDELPSEYNFNLSSGPYFIPRLQMVYELGYDYCISICCKNESVVNEKLEILRNFGLKKIMD
ncbi:hypothetical protein DSECCO2_482220 [anaerobic digester metagenome]